MRGKMLIFLAMLCLFLLAFGAGVLNGKTLSLEREIKFLRQEIEAQELQLEISRRLLQEVIRLRAENEELHRRMQEWLDEWQVDTFEVTAYTLECGYPWDDGFTFLGTRAASGQTVAVDPEVISLGSEIFIHGLGWRKAEDIGTAVKGYTVDLYMGAGPEAKALAMRWGRKTVKVVYMKNGHSD